ncbi:MAG: hypothetical protein B6U76_00145 [Desulfurococcales archaeon ex4484_217_2]|nr:MAG: hypothetical protein B6U76_00145 [Desulfurococcales archaeon ex4484_217_2]
MRKAESEEAKIDRQMEILDELSGFRQMFSTESTVPTPEMNSTEVQQLMQAQYKNSIIKDNIDKLIDAVTNMYNDSNETNTTIEE